jgi:hypothetical protein
MPQPSAQVSPSSLSFGNQNQASTSGSQTVTLSNTGSALLTITSIAASSNFGETNNCAGSVAPSGSCTIKVTFSPMATGSLTGTLSITDNSNGLAGSTQTVGSSGTGTAPLVSLSTAGLSFANQLINTPSASQAETVTNTGSGNLTFATVTIGGTNPSDFAKSADTCTGATVTPNNACTVSVTFTPSATGSRSASLNFADNANGSPQTVGLSGTGTAPLASLSTAGLSFANQLISITSAPQAETVTNTGTGNLTFSTVTIGGTNPSDFAMSADTCTGVTVTPNNACTVSVTFTPSATGSRSASLNFADNANGSPQTVGLSGTGTAPLVSLSTAGLSFANQLINTSSASQVETVTNTGSANLTFSTVTIGGTNPSDFAKSADTCTGVTVTPNNACTVSVTFTPSATGSRSASLNFADNASGSPQTVSLTGIGIPFAQVSPSSVTFGGQMVGTTSSVQPVTLTDIGPAAINVTGVNISGDFSQTNNCPASLQSRATCSVQVAFTPTVMGTRAGTLTITTSAASTAQTVNLAGLGTGPLAGVFTQRYDNGRTGANTQETFLTASNVTESQFGKLFSLPVDGQVYAQPLYMQNVSIPSQGAHNVVFIATQHDSVYAFDADTQSTTPLWQVSFLNSATGVTTVPCQDVYGTAAGACDINPEIGITSTPVIDPTSGTLYVTAKTREPLGSNSCSKNGTYNYCYRLHALDITTGAEKSGGPVIIAASVSGTGYDNDSVSGAVTFTALYHLQRPGLLLLNGTVYLGFGSHGDNDPYHGWLIAYNATTLQQVAVFNVTPNGGRGAIWQGGGGISADADGNIYIVTANGTFDANTAGGVDYGDSVLKMQIQSGQFQILDYFTPADQLTLAVEDLDLGSSPALILPDQPGAYPHLLATGGKDGRVWLVNRDNLGHLQANDAGAVQVIPNSDSLFGGGTYWNANLYTQVVGDFLKQFPLQSGVAQPAIISDFQVGFPNPSPAVSANGTNNAVLWLVEADAFKTSGPAVLRAFDATDVSNPELYDSTQAANGRDQAGPAVKFVVPTIANGKVYVGAGGEVDVYGLLP